ncbi:hypothetical protein ACG7TL_008533 [Trametes sanguinea]
MSAALQYLPHIIYTIALTSIATHHLQQRKEFEAERAHVAAQLSILEDLRGRLSASVCSSAPFSHSGQPAANGSAGQAVAVGVSREQLDRREIERLWRLAKTHDVWRAREQAAKDAAYAQHAAGAGAVEGEETIGWKEVLFGKRFDTRRSEELDRKDWEKGEFWFCDSDVRVGRRRDRRMNGSLIGVLLLCIQCGRKWRKQVKDVAAIPNKFTLSLRSRRLSLTSDGQRHLTTET